MKNIWPGKLEVILLNPGDEGLIQLFLNGAMTATKTFQYFDKRPVSVIKNHRATYLLKVGDRYIGYGHLDEEDEIVWLGIAIADNYQGLGLSKVLMSLLISSARLMEITRIRLSVGCSNIVAIKLYERFGFNVLTKSGDTQFMEVEL